MQRGPAALDIGVERLLEAGRRGHAAIGMADAAFLVADRVEREEHLLRYLAAFRQNRVDKIRRRALKARQVCVAVKPYHMVEDETGFADGG